MKTIKANFKVCILVFKHIPLYVVFSILFAIFNALYTVIDLYIIERVIDLLEIPNITLKEILIFLAWSISLKIICEIIMSFYRRYLRTRYRNIWVKKMQRIIFSKAMTIDISYFDDPALYDKFSRALKQCDLKSIDCFDSIVSLVTSFLGVATLIMYIALTTPILCIITIVTSIIAYLCYLKINKISFKAYKDIEVYSRRENYIKRTFYLEKNACDIKTTNIASLLINESEDVFNDKDNILKKSEKKTYMWRLREDFIYQIVTNFVIYVYLMAKVFKGEITIGKFSALISAVFRFISRFYNFSFNIAKINENALYVEDFLWLLNYKVNIEETSSDERAMTFNSLLIKDLSFKYPNQEFYALSKINLEIKKGEKLAIIGYNGAGKTTLTKLLLKLYNPESGQIFFNNQSYENIKAKDIRRECSIIMQDFQIYCASIIENILMRQVESEEDINIAKNALEKVNLLELIERMPNGLDTILTKEFSNDGIELSGGEKQKIAIARVFASNAPIAILDEPTSSLDPIAEKEINDRIMKMSLDKTIIIISHRLSTIVNADRIIMMKEGKIIEEGNHKELMEKNTAYKEMFLSQAMLYHK